MSHIRHTETDSAASLTPEELNALVERFAAREKARIEERERQAQMPLLSEVAEVLLVPIDQAADLYRQVRSRAGFDASIPTGEALEQFRIEASDAQAMVELHGETEENRLDEVARLSAVPSIDEVAAALHASPEAISELLQEVRSSRAVPQTTEGVVPPMTPESNRTFWTVVAVMALVAAYVAAVGLANLSSGSVPGTGRSNDSPYRMAHQAPPLSTVLDMWPGWIIAYNSALVPRSELNNEVVVVNATRKSRGQPLTVHQLDVVPSPPPGYSISMRYFADDYQVASSGEANPLSPRQIQDRLYRSMRALYEAFQKRDFTSYMPFDLSGAHAPLAPIGQMPYHPSFSIWGWPTMCVQGPNGFVQFYVPDSRAAVSKLRATIQADADRRMAWAIDSKVVVGANPYFPKGAVEVKTLPKGLSISLISSDQSILFKGSGPNLTGDPLLAACVNLVRNNAKTNGLDQINSLEVTVMQDSRTALLKVPNLSTADWIFSLKAILPKGD